jgi:hypothetical protein
MTNGDGKNSSHLELARVHFELRHMQYRHYRVTLMHRCMSCADLEHMHSMIRQAGHQLYYSSAQTQPFNLVFVSSARPVSGSGCSCAAVLEERTKSRAITQPGYGVPLAYSSSPKKFELRKG